MPEEKYITLDLTEEEWLELVKRESSGLPEIIGYNANNSQWVLMDENLTKAIERATRLKRLIKPKVWEMKNSQPAS
jgi:DNA-directed RNA polymerase beta' subunit